MKNASKKPVLILSAILVLLTVASLLAWFYLNTSAGEGHTAEIYQDGQLIHTIKLDTVTSDYTLRVDGENGAYNIIEVHHNEIGIIEASCPDSLCVNMGFIHSSAMPVTCLPNKVVIRIVPGADDDGPDVVVY